MRMLAVSDGKDGGKVTVSGWMEHQQRMEPEPRMDKIARVRMAIASGTYHVSAEALADRLLAMPARGRSHGGWTS